MRLLTDGSRRGTQADRASIGSASGRVACGVERRVRVRVVGDPPQLADGAGDQLLGRLRDTGRLDRVGVRVRVRRRMVVFGVGNVNVVAAVRVVPPPEVHARGVGVVELVVVARRPRHVDAGLVGVAESVREFDFEGGRIEVVVVSGVRAAPTLDTCDDKLFIALPEAH